MPFFTSVNEMSINYIGLLFRMVFSMFASFRRRLTSSYFFYWGNAKAM